MGRRAAGRGVDKGLAEGADRIPAGGCRFVGGRVGGWGWECGRGGRGGSEKGL